MDTRIITSRMCEQSNILDKGDFTDIKKCLAELKDSSDELNSILSSMSLENPVSDTLLKNKYLVLIIDDLIPFQKPTGEHFRTSFVICAAKKRKLSVSSNNTSDVFTEDFGNPLSVQFDALRLNSDKTSVSFAKQLDIRYDVYALPQAIGKQLLFMCSSIKTSHKLPFIVICQGNDLLHEGITYYGSYEQDTCFSLKVVNQGLVTKIEKAPSIYDIRPDHLEGFLGGSAIESHVFAHYDFLGHETESSGIVPMKGVKLSIDCSWSECRAVLEPVIPESICIARINAATIGDDDTGLFNKFKELKLLRALEQSLKTNIMKWLKPNSYASVPKEIKDLISGDRPYSCSRDNLDYPKLNGTVIEETVRKERGLLYFPDKLWLILQNCSSFEEVIEAIQYVYGSLGDAYGHRPLICSKDMSTISRDIHFMFERYLKCPDLTFRKAAELLIEIGVEKLRKDYEHIFVGLGLVPLDIFSYFINPELLSPESITCLEKLHSVLELMIVCLKVLNLPVNILSGFARNALKHYTLIPEVDLLHVFNLQVPVVYVRPLLNQMRPTTWELSLITSNKSMLKQSIYHFRTKAAYENIYAPENYHPKLIIKGSSYVYLTGVLIEDFEKNLFLKL